MQFEGQEPINRAMLAFIGVFTVTASYFIFYDKFFPLNNSSLTHIGIMKYALDSFSLNSRVILAALIMVIFLAILLIKEIKSNKFYGIILAYFILLTALNVSVMYYDTQNRWLPAEGVEIGHWINRNLSLNSTFIFDIEDYKNQTNIPLTVKGIRDSDNRPTLLAAYWIRGNYKQANISEASDYIITSKELDKEIVYVGSKGTKIYKS